MVHLQQPALVRLGLEEVRVLLGWARDEGWNPGPGDADVFYATDPEGFYGYFVDGQLIAGGAVVSYGGLFGFMGLFIVRPDYRGSGIGRKLWHERKEILLARLQPGAAIGMDGVLAMQPFYTQGGFRPTFRDERYRFTSQNLKVDGNVYPFLQQDFADLMEFDARCFGVPRPAFLAPWLRLSGSHCFVYRTDGVIRGYAMLRKAHQGYKICPLFAGGDQVADELFRACLNAATGQDIYLDIPVVNQAAIDLAKRYQGEYVFECARMYLGTPPPIPLQNVYGITTFELG